MNRNNIVGLVVITAALILSLYFLKDSAFYYAKPVAERQDFALKDPTIFKRIFNLGLDLQGGMRMVLEVDKSKLDENAQKDLLDRAFTVIENRINGLGVAEPTIQKQGTDRIIVELPGLKDEKSAKNVIGSTAQLEFNLLREPAELSRAITLVDDVVSGKASKDSSLLDSAATDSATIKQKEGQDQARQIFEANADTAVADTAEKADKPVESFMSLLMKVGEQIGVMEKNTYKVDEILARSDVRSALERAGLGGNVFLWGRSEENKENKQKFKILYYVKSRPELKGDGINDAQSTLAQGGMQQGQAIVELEMNRKGARIFSRVTGMNVGKYLAIILDSTVYSAPVIRDKISGGRAQIEGNFTMQEAKDLAVVLRAGALPAPVKIIEERIVGPSLGQDSTRLGVMAMIIAYCLVLCVVCFYYRLSGFIAAFAMSLNMLFVFALMAGINQTLTLPGIAGLILTIGMSVDANVLIFERTREELALGKTVRSAIDAGYHRAFYAIFDSNVTTILTGLVLYFTGTGPIKGFAITLMFGLVFNFFTSVYVTRVIFNIMTRSGGKNLARLSI